MQQGQSSFHVSDVMVCFMKDGSPALLPLLRSRAQGEILAWIVLHPVQEFSLVEIARSGQRHNDPVSLSGRGHPETLST